MKTRAEYTAHSIAGYDTNANWDLLLPADQLGRVWVLEGPLSECPLITSYQSHPNAAQTERQTLSKSLLVNPPDEPGYKEIQDPAVAVIRKIREQLNRIELLPQETLKVYEDEKTLHVTRVYHRSSMEPLGEEHPRNVVRCEVTLSSERSLRNAVAERFDVKTQRWARLEHLHASVLDKMRSRTELLDTLDLLLQRVLLTPH